MLDKLEKLEDFLNSILSKLFTLIAKLINLVVPKFVFTTFHKIRIGIWKSLRFVKNNSVKTLFTLIGILNRFKDKVFHILDVIQKYPVKQKALQVALNTKTFLFTTSPKDYHKILNSFCHKKCERVSGFFKSFKENQVKIIMYTVPVFLIGGGILYYGVYEIIQQQFPHRKPASIDYVDDRALYHLYEKKTITVQNVKVPIHQENVNNINSVTIDFGLKLSTRFARYYISEFEYKLKDYFFTAVEPVVSDFPIEPEGKEVLKEKIKEEVDQFLIDNNIEGEVEEVYILYIVAS